MTSSRFLNGSADPVLFVHGGCMCACDSVSVSMCLSVSQLVSGCVCLSRNKCHYVKCQCFYLSVCLSLSVVFCV